MNRARRTPAPFSPIWIGLLLALATVIVFLPSLDNGFVDYDDNDYITANPHVQTGLTLDGLKWAFTTFHASNWHPLTWVSHMLDYQIFGLRPWGHHLTSLLIHAVSASLLFLLLWRTTAAPGASAFAAALFALHPLRVESVAWAAERKDVLSVFFWLLTMGAYIRYVQRPSSRRYATVLLSYALGLMAKPMLVTLPFVLMLIDVWPLGRKIRGLRRLR